MTYRRIRCAMQSTVKDGLNRELVALAETPLTTTVASPGALSFLKSHWPEYLMEAACLGPPWLAVVGVCIAVGEMIIVLVLRAHYTLDVVAGALAAFLAAAIAGKLSPSLDALLR